MESVDTRPLSEKLKDVVVVPPFQIDISHGVEFRLIGNGHDLERVRAACKQMLKRIENDKLDPSDKHVVTVPAREE